MNQILCNKKRSKRYQGGALCALWIGLFALAACQPTPVEDIVYSKEGAGSIMSAAPGQRYEAPATCNVSDGDTIFGVWTDIIIEAEVRIPDTDKYPAYYVMPEKLTPEQVGAFISGAFETAEVFTEVNGDGVTKRMHTARIQEYQAMLADEEVWQEIAAQYDEELLEYYQSSLQERIDTSKAAYGGAPDEVGGTNYTAGDYADSMTLFADLGGVKPGEFSLNQTVPTSSYLFFDAGRRIGAPLFMAGREHMKKFHQEGDLRLTMEEAQTMADQFVDRCGVSHMRLVAAGIDSWFRQDTDALNLNFKPIYMFVYTPVVDGMGMAYVDINYLSEITYWSMHHPEGLTNQVWYPNALHVFVGNDGVESVTWRNPSKISITETISENAALLPFDTIVQRFLEQIRIMPTFYSNNVFSPSLEIPGEQSLHITTIELSYACVLSGNGADSYVLIPVWDFFGYMDESYSDKTQIETALGRSYMTINAIDGSVIDRIVGY